MPKLTSHKFHDQSEQYRDYSEVEITQAQADLLIGFFQLQRKVAGFYKHILTMDNQQQYVIETAVLDIIGYSTASRRSEKPVHVLHHDELVGLMHALILRTRGLGSHPDYDQVIEDYYSEHPNLKDVSVIL